MDPIFLLRELSLLQGNSTVLDVGTKDGSFAKRFADLGFKVDAIDTPPLVQEIEGVSFQQISIDDFLKTNTKIFDITVMRHVAHILKKPITTIEELNEFSRIFYFTCFGPKDDWAGKVQTLEHNEVLDLFPHETIKHHSEAFQYGKTYAGDEKFWHIHTFVIKN